VVKYPKWILEIGLLHHLTKNRKERTPQKKAEKISEPAEIQTHDLRRGTAGECATQAPCLTSQNIIDLSRSLNEKPEPQNTDEQIGPALK
jgi:hypothetical protein